jgi:hypothetical protein
MYNVAYNAAEGMAQSAWDNIGRDCTKLDQFVKIISLSVGDAVNKIGTPPYTGTAAEDFGTGFIHGLRSVLGRVAIKCVNECHMLGRAMGEWAAKMFCRVAAVIGATPSFTSRISNVDGGICGRAYRRGCENNFVGVAGGMCPTYAKGSAFDKYYEGADGGCCGYDPN